MNNLSYLKPNLVVAPLFDNWYAWTHLISPATAAMNLTGRHLKIMNSFIQSPRIHASAVKNPKMLGGPFMDINPDRVDEIVKLREQTLLNQAKLIEFSESIKTLDLLLKRHKHGYSVELLYNEIPDILKGFIEIVYDLNNNLSFRIYESLLYGSEFYNKRSQSIALWLTENDDRPFCLSTPLLSESNVIHLPVSFDDSGIDKLCSMKRNPGSITDIALEIGVTEDQMDLFETFFTERSHPTYSVYNSDKIRMRYFGHACILIETKEISILVDPLISYYGYESSVDHYSDVDLPDFIDYVLITHNHQDHVVFETLIPLRHKIGKIIVPCTTSGALQDPNLKLTLENTGFKNVIEVKDMEKLVLGDCVLTGIPFIGEHSDLNIQAKSCFHLAISGFTLMFVADSRIIDFKIYEHIEKMVGAIDVIFLGMECDGAPLTWLYGPLLTEDISRENDQSRRLSGSDYRLGVKLVDIFSPKEVYVYAMGQEPWLKFISSIKYTEESNPIIQSNKLVEECLSRGIIAERLFGEKELLYNYSGNKVK
ncbi:MBL fold metallo-hydrolase [Sphingobacterium sp. ML3W]|uniref:MBL fold metallo-hydrolase n=1 Tax=Sphingobacterium sp. ML3W TaxID=1538644 RepID=UPI00249B9B38|nr:MBL fold metallo-hydrolase [Sphingobacterium sp. ML3W]WFA78758.1 MBL fold metallo-hydrolase [Sphingobacterium sp. ML3W]